MSLRHALLGFLALRPMSGYDLNKAFAGSAGHFWPADQSQIYRTLAQLVAAGQVEVDVQPQAGRPDRREHRILPAGLAELDAWLASPLDHGPTREPFLARMFFADRLGAAGILTLLDEREDAARALLTVLESITEQSRQHLADSPPDLATRLRMATLSNGIAHARAEIDWVNDTRAALAS